MYMVGLPPGMIITSSGETLTLKRLPKIGRDRFAQRQDADRGRVAVMAVTQRLHRRLDDEIRRAEIGLADAEIDDVAALRGKLRGAREHRKGVLFADAIEGGDGFQHDIPPAFNNGPQFSPIGRQMQTSGGPVCTPASDARGPIRKRLQFGASFRPRASAELAEIRTAKLGQSLQRTTTRRWLHRCSQSRNYWGCTPRCCCHWIERRVGDRRILVLLRLADAVASAAQRQASPAMRCRARTEPACLLSDFIVAFLLFSARAPRRETYRRFGTAQVLAAVNAESQKCYGIQ